MWPRRNADREEPDHWEPVSEESPGRRLSVPRPWLCAVTDIGKCRTNNEDAYFLSADCNLWIVADGMGGHAAGEIASALTIHAIAKTMASAEPHAAELDVDDRLIRAFAVAQRWVSCRSLRDAECQGMGSTALAAVMDGKSLHLCHVGDVRTYILSEGRLRLTTNDHSWVWQQLVLTGLLTPDRARLHPQRGAVTQAIGTHGRFRPELTSVTLQPGDRVLLCSDGLWEALDDRDIGAIISSVGSMAQLASTLVDRANAASGKDNITVVLYEHRLPLRDTFEITC